MSSFQEEYARVLDNAGCVSGIVESSLYAANVQKTVDDAIQALQREAAHRVNVPEDYLKGWLAEQWHAETLKISGAARGRNDVWAQVDPSNSPGVDVRYGDAKTTRVAEVKYYKTGEDTAKAISRPEYSNSAKIVPGDQKESVIESADRLAKRNSLSRPEQAEHYRDTAERADDHLTLGNASSKALDETQSREMAKDFKRDGDIDAEKHGLNTEGFVEWSDIARESGKAALHAAAISAALTAAPHIWVTIKEYLDTGEIDPSDLEDRGKAVLLGAGTSGLRGGVAAGLTAACKTGLMGNSLKNISPVAIGMATTITMNAINYSIQLNQNKITAQDFVHNCLQDTFVLAGGFGGAAIGQLIIPVPMVGALAGNIIGSTLGAVVFNGMNHVVLGICIESGWAFFGIVKQDYTVPEDILKQAGYDLFSTQSFSKQSFTTGGFNVKGFTTNSLSFIPVSRGVYSCNAVGYA